MTVDELATNLCRPGWTWAVDYTLGSIVIIALIIFVIYFIRKYEFN